MLPKDRDEILKQVVAALSATGDDALTKAAAEGMPERGDVVDWVERCKRLVLTQRVSSALNFEILVVADRLESLLCGLGLDGRDPEEVALAFVVQLPAIRALLAEDVEAAFEGDPAAKSFAEIVVSYPSIRAIAVYRIAHALAELGVPILPRMMTEKAHDRTGIDIHPSARIGRRFFIDHGTGVVIGETTEIGDNVRLYQGVTLGAKSPRHGRSLRGVKRHPTIEDDVTIYAGATILGGDVAVGRGSVIGGNVFLLESVPEDSRVVGEPPSHLVRQRNKTRQLQWDI
ncbi:MAG: serine acetyltransferase [Myxococcota bacterium]|jgi:serine O-acetyltransferase|nr:serine acetyltransferase [Deltaproteobacteria bacterium]MCP4242150.1 serine acetyltransferase [bacterium]MDP6074121.1 serine acetyltransferase [Myxococcota bacterium]MDP6241808.1 serine acetyltransferase [Myxococcota bacterium]MDP7074556.1 serine acetyltransferase [Myxococcota bacterium]